MADSSFDIVSKIDHQEVANALNSASREVATRYDFKNVGASIAPVAIALRERLSFERGSFSFG